MQQGEQKLGDTNYHYVKCNVLNAAQSQEIITLKAKIARLSALGDTLYELLDPPSPCMRMTEYDNALQGWDDEKGLQ